MDLLKSVIRESQSKLASRKRWRKAQPESSSDSDSDAPAPAKKYLRRGEQERIDELQKQDALSARRAPVKEVKREASSSSALDNADQVKEAMDTQIEDEEEAESEFTTAEVQTRLRKYGQPITLFGETRAQRLERLKNYENLKHSQEHGAMGDKNIYQDLKAQVENDILIATLDAFEGEQDEEKQKEMERKQERARKRDAKYTKKRPRSSFKYREDYISFFLKRMLREWEIELDGRTDQLKSTTKGKNAATTHKQTRSNLKPFLTLLSRRTVPDDILRHTEKIVDFCDQREYVRANEAYLMLAIGNAAWPMGVTMVGIHERAGREKIFSQQQAHVLNDETQRKYVQAIKRLMTFCQHKYRTVPSKMGPSAE